MICYKPTSGCGVYENRSCSECPYSKPLIKPLAFSKGRDKEDLKEKVKDKEVSGSNS